MSQDKLSKKQMLDMCRDYYKNNKQQLKKIEEFRNTYTREKAIEWYTHDCFLYKLLNKALRTEDIESLFTFRFFSIDLCSAIEQENQLLKNEETLTLYRGTQIPKEEFEKIKENVGKTISTNGFLSTSRNINVSLVFIPTNAQSNDFTSVLFEIKVNPLLKTVIFTDVGDKSRIKGEEEVLFNLNSLFKIVSVCFDSKLTVWKVELNATDEGAEKVEEYLLLSKLQMEECSPLIYFGRLLIKELGQVDRAGKYFNMLLKSLPHDHPDIAAVYNNIGAVYYKKNELNLALKNLEIAYEMRRKQLPSNHPHIAGSLYNIGGIYKAKGDSNTALDYYQQALGIFENLYPGNNLLKADTIGNIGGVYMDKEDSDTALTYLSRALKMYKHVLPDQHSHIATCLGMIGYAHEKKRNLDIALDYYQQQLNMEEQCLPFEHYNLSNHLGWIIDTYKKMNEIGKALDLCHQKLVIQKRRLGKNHTRVARTLMIMADLIKGDNHNEALEQALSVLENCTPSNYQLTSKCLTSIGCLYSKYDMTEDALRCQLKALELYRQTLSSDHINIAKSLKNIGLCYEEMNNLSEVLRYFNESLSIYRANYGSKHVKVKRGEAQGMNVNNNQHLQHDIIVNSNYIHKKANIMPIDRSKFMYHNGQLLPVDYVLVYTRYHSNHFRRSHKFNRQHDEYRQFFQDRLRKLGFIIAEERLTDEENDLLNLRQAETSADVPDNNTNSNNEENHVLVRGLSTLQRHVSVRLQNISSHLKKDTQDTTHNNDGTSTDAMNKEEEEESIQLNDSREDNDDKTELKQSSQTLNENGLQQDERYFVKIHAPFEVLLVLAEKLKVKLPFSENKAPLKPGLLDQGLPCQFTRLDPTEFPKPYNGKTYFTACYQKSLHYRFSEHFGDIDKVFRPAERSRLVYEVLLRCPYRSPELLITGDAQGMNVNNNHHLQHDIIVNSNYIHKKANIMPIDRSKFMYYNGQLLPVDYVLVYTRYHSNHFRRSHKFNRQHDEYRQFFQDRLRKLGFIIVEERLTDEENDLLNLRQAETSADVPDNNTNSNNEENHVLVRGLSTLQRHVSVRLQNISSHLKKDTQDTTHNNDGTSTDAMNEEEEEESIQLNDSREDNDDKTELKQSSQTLNENGLQQDERYFVKIHAPFEVLLVLAEKLKVKLPFSENKAPLKPGLLDQGLPCQFTRLDPTEFPKPYNGKTYFTACYQKSLHYRFSEHFGDIDKVFRPAERSRLVYEVLLRCPYRSPELLITASEEAKSETSEIDSTLPNHKPQQTHTSDIQTLKIEELFTSSTRRSGIEVLLEESVYEAAFPLHDQLIRKEDAGEPETWNDRMKLYHRWAKFQNIFRVQPIHAIRDYYGERLAFYFAWLGWYNSLLMIPSILGIFVLLWGLLSVKYDRPTLDICNSTSSYLMCPKIDRQAYWFLNETCFNAKMSYVFDNSASVAFAILISIFAVSVNFLWQRQENRLQFEWDMTDIAEETETLRPDFERRARKTVINKVTDKLEPYVPAYKRLITYISSFSVVLFMVLLVLAVVAGIEVLLEESVYEAAFPLHDQLIRKEDAGEPETWNDRMKLYHRWAKFRNIFRVQPIHAIRDYYGERLAFYFAWLGWYNSLLMIPSVLGIFVLLWGLLSVKYDRPTLDICNSTSSYLMCPKIDRQAYWFLNETCFNAKMSYVFDNSASVAFAILISVFAVSVNFLWQRQENRLQFEWDMTDIAEETETLRPDFERRARKTVINKVTDKLEPYVPAYKRLITYISSFSVVLFMVLLVLAVVAGIVVYRLSVSAAFNSIDREMWIYRWKPIIVPITGALINLIIILILQYFYEILAIWLTNAELHRTDKTYEASLTIKMFLFQFVNYYASIFYIALIKPLIIYKPTYLDRHLKAFRLEECDVSGCVWELSIQLIIIMVGKQLISNIWEFYFSKLWNMCRKRIQFRQTVRQINERNAKMTQMHKQTLTMNLKRSYEEDFLLQPFELTTLFYEYLEIILQFGFVTFFCLAFPLAPLFALINNIFEIRIDALKVVKEFRRPMARRAMGIGTWNSILNIMAKVTVLSNAFLIAITSEYIPRQVYYWTIGNRSLNGFLNHTLAAFHSSDFPTIINRTLLECQFIESRLFDLSKKSAFYLPFAQSNHLLDFDCNSPFANGIRSQIDFSTCYYKDYRLDHTHNYARSYMFYYVMVARLAFVIVFEHFVYCILFLVRNLILRVPRNVRAQLDRCRYLVQQMYWGAELYAQNPNLIKKDENRVRADEADHEHKRQSTLPTLMTTSNEFSLNNNASLDL
ncbi:unnamed protein product [Adineta steineri]|uniref:Multifunctional fusion protein n=2 Tax=Adineta steineri TaxID=433720 RepID=A0A815CKY4_9BILA|nr:unnamed protein product [Adineta steineri]